MNFKNCKHNKGFYKGQYYERCNLCHAARSLCMSKNRKDWKKLYSELLEENKRLANNYNNLEKALHNKIDRLNTELGLWRAMVGGLKSEVKLLKEIISPSSFKDEE